MKPFIEQLEQRCTPAITPLEGFAWDRTSLTVYLAPSLDPWELFAAEQAIRDFNALPVNLKLFMTKTPGGQVTIANGSYPGDVGFTYWETNGILQGKGVATSAQSYFDGPLAEGLGIDLHELALHELGHAIGLAESPDPSDVMYTYVHPIVPPPKHSPPWLHYGYSLSDVEAFWSMYGAGRVWKYSLGEF